MGGRARAAAGRGVSAGAARERTRAAVVVRPARREDLAAVQAIELEAFTDPWPASAFREALASGHLYFSVAVDAPVGVVGYLIGWFAAGEGEIANIAVSCAAQGRGIGGRLLDDALTAARAAGAEVVHLEVRASNDRAQALYASRGFGPVGRRRAYYRDPVEDAIVLRCALNNEEVGPVG